MGFNRRYDYNFRAVKEALLEKEIGSPHSVKVTSRDPAVPSIEYIKKSGGLFFDMTIHDYDMIRYIVGSEPTSIYAQGHCCINPEVEKSGDIDTAMCMINFENKALAIIDNNRRSSYGYDQRIEVFGDQGNISTENDTDHTLKISNHQGVSQGKPKHFFLERYREAYVDEVTEFIDRVLSDKPISTTGEDGYRAELLAHAANRSWQEQRPVELSEFAPDVYQR
ncbi:Gfo/Idh/MocA family protein [Marinococcus halophilus]|uniref:Gfo/Idh/MocA family protein n=1 Tax=Marinococcus halophilus TaxID=1371 RepID=UPI00314527E5